MNTSPDRSTDGNRRDFQSTKQTVRQNDRDSWNSRGLRTGKSDFNREYSRYRNNTSWEQAVSYSNYARSVCTRLAITVGPKISFTFLNNDSIFLNVPVYYAVFVQ